MKTTGYGLREAIKQWDLRKEAAEGAFSPSLKAFPGETKDPRGVIQAFDAAELAVARLQTAQMRYNLAVIVEVQGEKLTLAEAIKRVGSAGRIEKMWTGSIGDGKRNPYSDPEDTRDSTSTIIRSERTITSQEAVKLTAVAGKRASALRAAISVANGREVEIEDLDPALFE